MFYTRFTTDICTFSRLFSCPLTVIYSLTPYVSLLMRLIEIIKNIDFVVYSASSLSRCYNETSRRLHTATLASTSFLSCIMNCAEYWNKSIVIDFYRKSISIELTILFRYRFLSTGIGNRYPSSIDIDYRYLDWLRLVFSPVAQSVEQRWSIAKVEGSVLALATVFLCPCVHPILWLGISLT